MTGGFGPPNTPPVAVKFDRPFVMAIEHYRTGALVFLGTVNRPSTYVAPVCPAHVLTWWSTTQMLHGQRLDVTHHHEHSRIYVHGDSSNIRV